MKKIIQLTFLVLLFIILFSGCRKIYDHIFNQDTFVVTGCRISKIVSINEFGSGVHTGIVYYNEHNNPDSIIFDFEGSSAGVSQFYFIYDAEHRLIEYRSDYSNQPGDYYVRHTYAYEHGIVVRDTTRAQIAGQATEVGNVHYDASGRIVKVTNHLIEIDHSPADEQTDPYIYEYDADGNRFGATIEYDDKISFLRTNKVWMFTLRNYSMNNLAGATSYNEHGLPTAFAEDKTPYFHVYLVNALEYQCTAN